MTSLHVDCDNGHLEDAEWAQLMDDAEWAQLVKMKNLEELGLGRTGISDVGINSLARLPRLRVVHVYNMDAPKLARLRQALPKCSVITDPNSATGGGIF